MTRNNLSHLIIFVIGILALFAGFLYLSRRFQRKMKPYVEKLETIAKTLPSMPCKLLGFIESVPGLKGHWSEHKFTLQYLCSDFGALPHSLQLRLYIRQTIRFSIYANYMRPSKVLFLKKIYTDEADLDKYDFYSNEPSEARKYLISHQTTLKKLSECGWRMPVFGRRFISIETDPNRSIDAENIKAALQYLVELRS